MSLTAHAEDQGSASRGRGVRLPTGHGARPRGARHCPRIPASPSPCLNSLVSHAIKPRATEASASRYRAVMAVPNGRPGSACQASQVCATTVSRRAKGKRTALLGIAVTEASASDLRSSPGGTMNLMKSPRIPGRRLLGISHIPTVGLLDDGATFPLQSRSR